MRDFPGAGSVVTVCDLLQRLLLMPAAPHTRAMSPATTAVQLDRPEEAPPMLSGTGMQTGTAPGARVVWHFG